MNENFKEVILSGKHTPFEAFVRKYLSHWLKYATPEFHREIYYVLEHYREYESVICLAPRYFAKSVIFNLFYPLYLTYVVTNPAFKDFKSVYNPDFNEIMIVGATQTKSNRWLMKLKREVTGNRLLLKDFGNLSTEGMKGNKWSEEIITLKTGFTIFGIGREGSSRGEHPYMVLIDDLESKESARSKEQCERIDDWIKTVLIPMFEDDQPQIKWIGTVIDRECVIDNAYNGRGWDDYWYRMKFGCYDNMDDRNPVWVDRWPRKKLEARQKKMGLYKFMCEYMNEPMGSENPIYRKDTIRYYKQSELPAHLYKIMSIDPAISEKETADFTAIIVIGICLTGADKMNIYVLDYDYGHWDKTSMINRIFEMNTAYRPDKFNVETVAFQKVLAQDFEHEAKDRGLYLPINEVVPHRDKVTRAYGVVGMFESGYVHFLEGNLLQDELVSQLLNFPRGKHDDGHDALQMCLDDAQEAQLMVEDWTEDYEDTDVLACPTLGI